MPRYYLGVDGGQSSTTALIADETGRVIGSGYGGPCNHVGKAEGRARFYSALNNCFRQACAQAQLNPATIRFAAACLGFSGGPEDKEIYTRELIRSERFKVTHDAEIALVGATAGKPGIIVIAGTGSMAFGRNASGKTARAGGWGYIFGDEGSALDIVRQALRAALQYEEGWGGKTVIREILLSEARANSANELLHRIYGGMSRADVAAFAPLIAQAAKSGDEMALQILKDASRKLAWFAESVHNQLFSLGEEEQIAYAGGVFESTFLRTEFIAQIQQSIGHRPIPPKHRAAAGALLEALRLDGNTGSFSNLPETA